MRGKKQVYEDEQKDSSKKFEEQTQKKEDNANVLSEQIEAHKDKYIRLMAEFDNFKKRTAVEYAKMVESANKALISDLIEIRETFERAFISNSQTDANAFKDGMKLIYNKFDEILIKHGLEAFGNVGEKFDPALHDAMMKQRDAEIPEEYILTIFEKGYKLKNNIIRHAKVVVSAGN
ncbi:MAG: nucleotide exchange factor GrpE [Chitinispirillales bacterium]|nr:nucleotide exchange factor GrpE [Chitinispirillales bacterium]